MNRSHPVLPISSRNREASVSHFCFSSAFILALSVVQATLLLGHTVLALHPGGGTRRPLGLSTLLGVHRLLAYRGSTTCTTLGLLCLHLLHHLLLLLKLHSRSEMALDEL